MALILPFGIHLPRIDPTAWVAPNATITGDVEIGPETSVWFNVVIRGDVYAIRIGVRTNIQDGTIIHATKDLAGTTIGDEVTIGHAAMLHACTLRDRCFIGMKAIVMDQAVVESYAMVAAGAVVTPGKRVPSGELWAGNPARKLRELSEAERAFMAKSAANYVAYASGYR